MKVSSSSPHAKLSELVTARESRPQAASGQAQGSRINLSSTARQMADLSNGSHDVNMQKVQALQQALAAGQLKINTSNIASSLLASAQELLK